MRNCQKSVYCCCVDRIVIIHNFHKKYLVSYISQILDQFIMFLLIIFDVTHLTMTITVSDDP